MLSPKLRHHIIHAVLGLAAIPLHAATTTLLPVADTYLRANQPTTAFGTATTIESNNANGVRVMLLRFDLSSIAQPITGLKLDLTAVVGSAGNQFQIFGLVAGESWPESTVTWATAPGVVSTFTGTSGALADYLKPADLSGGGTALATFGSAASGLFTAVDASSGPMLNFMNADADKIVTFLIAEADPTDTPGDRFHAREASSGQPTLTVTTGGTAPTLPTLIRVVIQSGQSNADGRADGSALPTSPINLQAPQSNVPFYFYTFGGGTNLDGTLGTLTTLRPGATQFPVGGVGPEITLGLGLAPAIEQQPGAALAIVKYAKGGSNLYADWKAGGDATTTGDGAHYQTLQRVVRDGLAKLRAAYPGATVQLAGMIWVQGESDIAAGSATSLAYGANLAQFIGDVRQTFSATLPFFFSRISSQQTVYSDPADPDYPNYLTLRDQQAQVAASVANSWLIDTDLAAITMNTDNLHFATGGQQVIGAAFADRMADVVKLRTSAFDAVPGGVRLRWNAIAGKSYRVLTGAALSGWATISVGATGEWTDTQAAGFPARFYRVEEVNDTVP